MKRYQILIKDLVIIPFVLILSIYMLIGEKSEMPTSIALWGKLFDRDDDFFLISFANIAFVFVATVLHGNLFYRHFCSGCIYIFTRISNRIGWYSKQVLFLLFVSFNFSFWLTITNLFVSEIQSTQKSDLETAEVFLALVIYSALLVFLSSLIVNLLSIVIGNLAAMIVIVVLISMSISTAINDNMGSFLRWGNPLFVEGGSTSILLTKSLIILIECLLVWLVGAILIYRKDIIYAGDE